MPKRAFNIYQRKRVVNINLNILAAGLLSIAIAKFPVMYISNWIGPEHKFWISVIAYVLDTTIDVILYYGLHWLANQWNPRGNLPKKSDRPKHRKFLQDATRIQAERMALVPIFMLIAMGGMWALQHYMQVSASWAFVYAFVAAMLFTRVIHTFWGYRSGTFKDHIDVIIDDGIQIGKDLSEDSKRLESGDDL
ncbi:MAG: hypothetical protein P1U42_09175 [Phycisphaerales bacterium]|nr:hypothetical protein [Phycisphaerales bacterium]